jgi:glycosyltransferase involved in cell wall biosynthesis
MSRRLDIGVASYRNPEKLRVTLESIRRQSVTDWRCLIIHNPSSDADDRAAKAVIGEFASEDSRFVPIFMDVNVGYAGAVNEIFRLSKTEYVAYCDNDIQILTKGWDEKLCHYLDMFHEIGIIFPNGGAYPIKRALYHEVMWGVGYCFMLNKLAGLDVKIPFQRGEAFAAGVMDESLGHQEEADLALRMRMAGKKCAALAEVSVAHNATATNSPESMERINRGVVNWVNKWCRYFCGENINYHSSNVLRWEDWPPNALYLEEYYKQKPELAHLNDNPEVINIDGREYDLIRVPRYKEFYRGRIV